MKEKDVNSLNHTTWRCQYHIVFAPKYRRMAIYNEIKRDIGKILRQLCDQKGIEIISAEACPDHIHMLVSIPPKYSVYVLIGNTMDNAMEACQSLPQEQRRISLKLKTHNNILFFEMSNPYTDKHMYRFRNNYHGYGLKNVMRCVEKYNGKTEVSKNEGVFQITAILNSV